MDSGLRAVMERVELVARSDAPVLIFGETGTGKELIARTIHNRSSRHAGPFDRVNCGAIPPELIDSQLFGHERGAFTGAVEARRGWFERADGGTLFLDEIGELPLAAQVRMLRILQDGWMERVGAEKPINVDVRIVAATNRDLAAMVAEGLFREDLWYRIAVFPIVLPPLRERREDIGSLALHFAQRAATRFGLAPVAPTADDLSLLMAYAWPGNVRELAAVIDRAAILGDGKRLDVAVALGVTPVAAPSDPLPARPAPPRGPTAIEPLEVAMRRHIEAALEATQAGSKAATAPPRCCRSIPTPSAPACASWASSGPGSAKRAKPVEEHAVLVCPPSSGLPSACSWGFPCLPRCGSAVSPLSAPARHGTSRSEQWHTALDAGRDTGPPRFGGAMKY